MKQIIQFYKTGEIQLVKVPAPALKKNSVLVKNINSLVSIGTEKYMLEMAKKSITGITIGRFDNPVLLGYPCGGIVTDVAEDFQGFKDGDSAACAGDGYGFHTRMICAPGNFL